MDGLCQEFLDSEIDKAKRMADSTKRLTNNLQRKRCYRKVASLLDYRFAGSYQRVFLQRSGKLGLTLMVVTVTWVIVATSHEPLAITEHMAAWSYFHFTVAGI